MPCKFNCFYWKFQFYFLDKFRNFADEEREFLEVTNLINSFSTKTISPSKLQKLIPLFLKIMGKLNLVKIRF